MQADICPQCARLNTFDEVPFSERGCEGGEFFLMYAVCRECGHTMFPEDIPKVDQQPA